MIAKVNNSVWDLDRPLEDDCSLQLLKFDDDEAQAVSLALSLRFKRVYAFPHYIEQLLQFSLTCLKLNQ